MIQWCRTSANKGKSCAQNFENFFCGVIKGENSVSQTYSRQIQRLCGLPFNGVETHSVVSQSDNNEPAGISDDGVFQYRSVCDSVQQQTSDICFAYPRQQRSGDRCTVNELGSHAFPQFYKFPAILNKSRQFQCKIVLVAPLWPQRSWFPDHNIKCVSADDGFSKTS